MSIYDHIPKTWAFTVRPNGYVYYATVAPDMGSFGDSGSVREFGWTAETREEALEGALRSAQEHIAKVEARMRDEQ